MPTLIPRDFQQIATMFEVSVAFVGNELPAYMNGIMMRFGGASLASDFEVLDTSMVDHYNKDIAAQSLSVHGEWCVFAVSGQGDLWLAHRQRDSVAFYDHDLECLTLSTLREIGLDIRNWIVLADLIGRYEQMADDDENPIDLANAINHIQSGLVARLPFSY